EPVQVVNLDSGVTQVVTGYWHACALKDGGVYCWGNNQSKQLGNNSSAVDSQVPVPVADCSPTCGGLDTGVRALVAGNHHTCALKGGAVYCWGLNGKGQLG